MLPLQIINLDRRSDRWQSMVKKLDAHSLPYERVSAIDGKELVINPEYAYLLRRNRFGLKRCPFAYALTNLRIWRQLDDSDDPYKIILDDDVTFCPNIKKKLEQTLTLIDFEKVDVCFLGFIINNKLSKHPNYSSSDLDIKIEPIVKHPYWSGSFGYLITKKGAEKMINLINQLGIFQPIDTIFLHCMRGHIKGFQMVCALPRMIFTQLAEKSNQVDSDIQRDGQKISFNFRCLSLSSRSKASYQSFLKVISEKYELENDSFAKLSTNFHLLITDFDLDIINNYRGNSTYSIFPLIIWLSDLKSAQEYLEITEKPSMNEWLFTDQTEIFHFFKDKKNIVVLFSSDHYQNNLEKNYLSYFGKVYPQLKKK